MPQIDLSILNQRQTPAFYADVLANRPAAGFIGRIFVSTNTFEFYRDNGTGWDLIGGPGAGTITGSGAAGQVSFWNGASTITGNNDLFWDNVNGHLGIGTNVPGTALQIDHDQNQFIRLNQTTATNDTKIAFQNSGVALWRIGNSYNAGANDFGIYDVVGAIQPITVKKTTGQVLIGTSTVGSGKLVVASATGDNGVQIVGASAPSLRIDNAESGPTKRAGLGISTAVNNFIQGSADRDFCIFNGSTTAASPILFGVYDAGATNVQEAARISAARNFLVGGTTDTGQKFQVTGNALINTLSIGLGGGSVASNTVYGFQAGNATNTGGFNVFLGYQAGRSNTSGNSNTAIGYSSLSQNISGTQNINIGVNSSSSSTSGSGNVSIGVNSLLNNLAGSNNVALGLQAGQNFNDINNSIFIGFNTNALGNTQTNQIVIGYNQTGLGSNTTIIGNSSTITTSIRGNLLLGTSTDAGFRFDCSGNVRVTGTFTQIGSSNTVTFGNGLVFDNGVSPTRIFGSSGTINYQVNVTSGIQHRFTNQGNGITSIGNLLQIDSGANLSDAASNLFIIYNQTTNPALFSVKGNGNVLIGTATSGASKLRIVGLPTSAAGLSSGDVYSNLGVLTIVP
jgi:hypothetical protein